MMVPRAAVPPNSQKQEIEELLPRKHDAYEFPGPSPASKGRKWPLDRGAVALVGRSYMYRQFRGSWRTERRHASKKVT